LKLVRNPDYDPATDSPAARQSFPDEFDFTVDANANDIVDRVAAGELDDENAASLPPDALERYSRDAPKRKYLHLNPADGIEYLSMNLTQAPFDDLHVRKAMNWIIDKAALRQAFGGAALARSPTTSFRTRSSTTSSPNTRRSGRQATTAASPRRSRR